MAHASHPFTLLNIPAALVWTRTPVRWKLGTFEFLRWNEPKQGNRPYTQMVVRYGEREVSVGNMDTNLDTRDPIELISPKICSGTKLELLVSLRNTPRRKELPADAQQMRDDFLALAPGDTIALLAFLNKWGAWTTEGSFPNFVHPEELWRLHRFYTSALLRGSKWWFGKYAARFDNVITVKDYPHILFHARNCEAGISSTISLDLLRNVRFKLCAREDCNKKLFRVKSNHARKFCSWYCGHIESVRRRRKK